MQRLFVSVGLAVFIAGVCTKSFATGVWMPQTVLQEGAKQVLGTPEFFWELECKRIAQEFAPPEKRIPAPRPENPEAVGADSVMREEFTTKIDNEEFATAVKAGEVNASNPEEAVKQHTAARDVLDKTNAKTNDPLPAELPSEFADYHQGAHGYLSANSDAAHTAWEKLLARPAAERKHRSTWAAYMLGKQCMDDLKYDEAVKRFQETRQLAKDGFVDSLGLAAESYGWEGLCELELGHAAQAARLYLAQLALGDASAVASLKLFVPDRQVAVLGDVRDTEADVTTKKAYGVEKVEDALAKAAADPLLRRLVTAHVLAVGVEMAWDDKSNTEIPKPERQASWLAAIEKAGLKDTADAEQLGWVAYSTGRYADAARWLKLSSGKTCAAQWLTAKLALREGKLKESAASFAEAVRMLPANQTLEHSMTFGDELTPSMSAWGDLGAVQLARSEFIQALDAFIQADLWEDAAYVAERCLTTKELLDYAQKHYPAEPQTLTPDQEEKISEAERKSRERVSGFRSLVARRLVREDNYTAARAYFDTDGQKLVGEYTAALKAGNNEKAGKKERARALFHASWLARHAGMELMGTEAGPDGSSEEGNFSLGDLAMVRLTGKTYSIEDEDVGSQGPPKVVKFGLAVTAEEKKRLAATKVNPERRFHYRHVAAGLAWKAAGLMPDGAEETADVLNTAGNWLKAKDEKAADRFYQAIERRCPKTEIGKEAVGKHWFVEASGPWSDEETARDEAEQKAREKANQGQNQNEKPKENG